MFGNLSNIALTVFGIGFIIFIHELGHFLAARAVGIRVEAFSIGFGKRLFGWTRGPTEYKVCMIPLGGYVKMAGEDPTRPTTGLPDEFGSKKVWQRVLVISAGVIMNMIFALIAVPIAFTVGVPFETPKIGAIEPNMPAFEAGLRPGDMVLAIDDRPILTWTDVMTDLAVAGERKVKISVRRDGKILDFEVEPALDEEWGIPQIGIRLARDEATIIHRYIEGDLGELPSAAHREVARQLRALNIGKDDTLVAINGVPLYHAGAIAHIVQRSDVMQLPLTLRLEKKASGAQRDVEVPFVAAPPDSEEAKDRPKQLGIVAGGPELKGMLSGGLAEQVGLAAGDIILAVNGEELNSRFDFARILGNGHHLFARQLKDAAPWPEPADAKIVVSIRRPLENAADSKFKGGLAPYETKELTFSLATRAERQELVNTIIWSGTRSKALAVRLNTPAFRSGLRTGDVPISIKDEGITPEAFTSIQERTKSNQDGEAIKLSVLRGSEVLSFDIIPEALPVNLVTQSYEFGIPRRVYRVGFAESLKVGLTYVGRTFSRIVQTLRSLISGRVDSKHMSGIVGIFQMQKQVNQISLMRGLLFLAMISINLAIVNLLPIPVLDGGWLVFLMIEKITGSPVSERTMGILQWVGLIFILGLMVYVTFHDIRRLIESW